jgi:hypothetical protein
MGESSCPDKPLHYLCDSILCELDSDDAIERTHSGISTSKRGSPAGCPSSRRDIVPISLRAWFSP